jgi:hypothetical protein
MKKSPLVSLVQMLSSSLHAYLAAARVWTFPGQEAIKLALVDLADDERSIRDRAGRILEEHGEIVPRPVFPISFTGLHDVDLASLLPRLLEGLRRHVDACDRLLEEGGDAEALDLVRQAREAALQHGDVLESVGRRLPPAAGPAVPPAAAG